jgi:hypothetical protein
MATARNMLLSFGLTAFMNETLELEILDFV